LEKRAFDRINTTLEISYRCCSKVHKGTVTNLSEKGMFITMEEMCFPFDFHIDVFVPSGNGELHVPVNLSRISMSPDLHDGIGVELPDPPRHYLDFVNDLRSAS
jgi:hypothetical protein